MKLRSIWFMSGYPLKERIIRTKNWFAQEVAIRLPKRIRYHVTVQSLAKATMTSKEVMATPLDVIMKHLDTPKDLR